MIDLDFIRSFFPPAHPRHRSFFLSKVKDYPKLRPYSLYNFLIINPTFDNIVLIIILLSYV